MLILDAGGDPPDRSSITAAAEALSSGRVVGVPTDTVYGLAADPAQPAATARLFALKGRPESVALPVLVAGWAQVESVAGTLAGAAARLAGRHWPGPLTLVVRRRREFVCDLGGPPSAAATVGVRWPDHAVMAALCETVGPLAVTSANRHGDPPAVTAQAVAAALGLTGEEGLALVLDGGRAAGLPSTVVECLGESVRCLRDGALAFDELEVELAGGPVTGRRGGRAGPGLG